MMRYLVFFGLGLWTVVLAASGMASQPLKQSTARIQSLSVSTAIRGIATDGESIFINQNGAEIRTFRFDG